MKIKIALLSIFTLLTLSGCGTIKSFFPDKEKDYRYTNEIPPLVVPPDIKEQVLKAEIKPQLPVAAAPQPIVNRSGVVTTPLEDAPIQAEPFEQAAQANVAAETLNQTATNPEAVVEKALLTKNFAADVDDSDKASVTEVVVVNEPDKTPQLRVNQNLARTWRLLGKALTRQAFEITKRNTFESYYLVQYDPDVKPLLDESIWDDVLFLFGSEHNVEQAYRINLAEAESQTYISLSTQDNQACKDEKCAKLFSALQDAIKQALKD